MSKAIFGAYVYSPSEKVYLYNPVMVGYYDLQSIDYLLSHNNNIFLKIDEISGGNEEEYKVLKTHTYLSSNVTYIAIALVPKHMDVTEGTYPNFNAAKALSDYIDKIINTIKDLEDEWNAETSKISASMLGKMFNDCKELDNVDKKLNKYKDKYKKAICMYTDPFVPYKDFVKELFNNCNFYDILPILKKRIELYKQKVADRRVFRGAASN